MGPPDHEPTRLPYMPLFVDDWLSSDTIEGFTSEQEGAYMRLLMRQWKSPNCTLPKDESILARYSRLGARWSKVGKPIVKRCFVEFEGGLANRRLREIWLKVREKSDKARAAANEGWRRRKQGDLL